MLKKKERKWNKDKTEIRELPKFYNRFGLNELLVITFKMYSEKNKQTNNILFLIVYTLFKLIAIKGWLNNVSDVNARFKFVFASINSHQF